MASCRKCAGIGFIQRHVAILGPIRPGPSLITVNGGDSHQNFLAVGKMGSAAASYECPKCKGQGRD